MRPSELNPMNGVHDLDHSGYIPNARTIIFAHGWMSSAFYGNNMSDPSLQLESLVDQLKALDEDYNLVYVDWGEAAINVKYWIPATNAQVVGRQVGHFISEALKHELNSIGDFYLVGHSLGAHVAAYAAKFVKERTEQKIRRITGK